jgi:tetratricopeptide (TPR) repeat protein/tRNA A-37 threonylcarbamoyl transferase component Bud32
MTPGDSALDLLRGILAVRSNLISSAALVAALEAWVAEQGAGSLGQALAASGLTAEHRALLEPSARALLERPGDLSTGSLVAWPISSVHGDHAPGIDAEDSISRIGIPSTCAPGDDPFATRLPDPPSRPGDGESRPRTSEAEDLSTRVGVAETGADPHATRILELAPPAQASRYPIVKLHARGGLGEVFLARDPELNRQVALKQLRDKHADDPQSRARFLREAEITGALEHPGIVPVYGLGRYTDGRPYYAMRFIRGESLKQAIQRFHRDLPEGRGTGRRTLALHQLLRRFVDVCNAVAFAHSRGVLHRDLKPENVMLGPFGETLVVDWGLAKFGAPSEPAGAGPGEPDGPIPGAHPVATRAGSCVGTPAYMSPEQAASDLDQMGPASDVYSLGATLYSILTGRAPVDGPSVDAILERARRGDFPAPGQVRPGTDPALEAVCLKAMALRPADRYDSARALADEIEHWLADEPVTSYREPWGWRLARWTRRHRAWVQSGAAAALAIVLILVAAAASIRHAWHLETLREAQENRRLAALRAEGEALVLTGQAALSRRDLARAQLLLTTAIAKVGPEPELDPLEALAAPLLAEAVRLLADQGALQGARAVYERFRRLQDEALFHATQFLGLDPATGRAWARAAIRDALASLGVTEDGAGGPVLAHPYLVEREEELASGCYELLLMLAEAEAPTPVDRAAGEPRDRVQRALRILDRAARLGRTTLVYHWQRADLLARLGDEPGARDERRRASLQSVSPFDQFLLGMLHHLQGDPATALPYFESALGRRPEDFWAQYHAAICLLKLDRPAEARAHLTACISRRPDFLGCYLVRGYALGELGQVDAAEADFRTAEGLGPDPQALYGLLVNRGRLRILTGRIAEAHADLEAAIALLPGRHEAYLNRAQAYRAQSKWDEALIQLDRAIRLAPDLAAPYRDRARLRIERGEPTAALDDLEQAIRRETAQPRQAAEDFTDRGLILFRAERYAEALSQFDGALVVQPGLPLAHRLRADALVKLGRELEAIEALDRSLVSGPPDADAYRLRGLLRKSLGQTAGAVEDFTRALEIGPDSSNMRTKRGWAYLLDGRGLALQDFDRAIALNPTNSDAHAGRGYALVILGRTGEGIEAAERAIGFAPRVPDLLYNAACVFAQAAGQTEAAGDAGDHQPLAARYGDRSLDLIGEALDLKPLGGRASFWRDVIARDPALDPIRRLDRFARLEAKYAPPAR